MGPLARYSNHQEIINRRLEQMYTSSDTRWEWPREGPLFESDSNKRRVAKTGLLFESPSRPSLKSGLLPLDRHGTCQEAISRRLEHIYTPSDTALQWFGEGPLYKLVSNKCKSVQTAATIQVISRPLLKSGLGLLFRYGTHQTINGRLDCRCIFHLTQFWNGVGRGHYSCWTRRNAGAKMWALFESPPGPLFMSDLEPLAR